MMLRFGPSCPPDLTVAKSVTERGLPMGVLFAVRPCDDPRVFCVAAAMEQANPLFNCATWRPTL